MKKILFSVIMHSLFFSRGIAQNIGFGNATPYASEMLEVKSSTKGMPVSCTSTNSRMAILNPAKGLIVYDTTTVVCWFHNGTAWTQLGGGSR